MEYQIKKNKLNLILVRHSLSTANVADEKNIPYSDIENDSNPRYDPLLAKISELCNNTRDRLAKENITHVYCSPLRRTLQTCNHIISNRNVILDDRLIEFGSKVDTKKHSNTYLKNIFIPTLKNNNRFDFKLTKEESYIPYTNHDNIKEFIKYLKLNHNSDDKILIVGHGWWIKQLFVIYNKAISLPKNCEMLDITINEDVLIQNN